jgi:hypothetical protein
MSKRPTTIAFRAIVIATVALLPFPTGVPARGQSVPEAFGTGQYLGPSSTAPAGNPAGGFALSIGMLSSSVRAGSTWSLNVEWRNVSRESLSVPRAAVSCMYDFTFRNDATGTTQSFSPSECDADRAGVQTIPPGHSYFFEAKFKPQDVRLSPGTFSVWAVAPVTPSWTGEPVISDISNSLSLRVLPLEAPTSSPGSPNAAAPHR